MAGNKEENRLARLRGGTVFSRSQKDSPTTYRRKIQTNKELLGEMYSNMKGLHSYLKTEHKLRSNEVKALYGHAERALAKVMALVTKFDATESAIRKALDFANNRMEMLAEKSGSEACLADKVVFTDKVERCIAFKKELLKEFSSNFVLNMATFESDGVEDGEEQLYQGLVDSFEVGITKIMIS